MHTKVLVKVKNHERSLEKLMSVVRESEFQVRNLNARLSLDESVFLLTMEVEGSQPTSALSAQLNSMNEVKSVEFSG